MRFIRAITAKADGAILAVIEQETLFDQAAVQFRNPDGSYIETEITDLGLVEEFEPVPLSDEPCSRAMHFFQRVEPHPLAKENADAPRVRVKPEHVRDCPEFNFCPADRESLLAHLRARGVEGLPAISKAWLCCTVDDDMLRASGIDQGVTLTDLHQAGMPIEEIRRLPRYRERFEIPRQRELEALALRDAELQEKKDRLAREAAAASALLNDNGAIK